MEVRARGPARAAHGSDDLTAFYGLSLVDVDVAHVAVVGREAIPVVDYDEIPVAHIRPAGKANEAPIRGQQCAACWRANV